jgi:type IX secretion system PorP/SprF family membrane protein
MGRTLLHIRISALGIALLASVTMLGQQEWTSTQYLFNLYDINAAYAGNHHALSAALRHRAQWTGIEGAPSTQMASLHAPLLKGRLGWGLRVQRETIGAREQWMSRGSFAYRMPQRDGSLSFALAAGIIRQEMDPDGISARDWNDPQLDGAGWRSTMLTLDAAVFYHTSRWFAGLEANRLNRAEMRWEENSQSRAYMHANLTAGRYFRMRERDLVALTGLVRLAEPGLYQADVNLTYLWRNMIWIGGGYRLHSGPVFLAECNFTRQFRAGYTYDIHTGRFRGAQGGSHEVFIGYNIKPRDDRSIRQF